MRKKKWLLIAVAILFFINLAFFILIRLAKVDILVKDKISNVLSSKLNAHVNIGDFTFNDKQLNISNFELIEKNNKYHLKVKHIYIEYNLPLLVFSNFTNLKSIKHIKIFEPEFEYIFQPSTDGKNQFTLPDISKYFKLLDIYDGKVRVEYTNDIFEIKNQWNDVTISIKNSSYSQIFIKAKTSDNSALEAEFLLKKGKIQKADINITDFSPDEFQMDFFEEISAEIDLKFTIQKETTSYIGKLKNLSISKLGKKASSKSIDFSGDTRNVNIDFENLIIDEAILKGNILISNFTNKDRSINGKIEAENVSLENYINTIKGNVSAEFDINGLISNPLVNGTITSNEIDIYGQKLKDVFISSEFKDKSVSFELTKSYWENNLILGNGTYSSAEKLKFKLKSSHIQWKKNDWSFQGNLISEGYYDDKLFTQLIINKLKVEKGDIYDK